MSSNWHLPARPEWLLLHHEDVIDPDLPIVDPHHHLWDRPDDVYLLPDILQDLNSGHNIRATVFVQCRSMYRASGAVRFRPVGETEFVTGIAAMIASGNYGDMRVGAGIVGHVDLQAGEEAFDILMSHIAAGGGRFRGVRHISAWDADSTLMNPANVPPRHLLSDRDFRKGFAQLAPLGLTFDAWLYHTQIDELQSLAEAFPDTRIVLNHLGGPLRHGPYADRSDVVFKQWAQSIRKLSSCRNVFLKLGGLGMRTMGFGLFNHSVPPSSSELVRLWKPYVDVCIDAFGAERCMFESNFPVDKVSCSYRVLWNAFKRMASDASAAERQQLFCKTAAQVYRLPLEEVPL